ncbi:hypothetical protein A5647_09070 [Mycobacterium sp. 1100029.7]|nr:hypothetical protein A5647_09070 [Mycobacterium sp. 1100029.7]
MNPRESQRGTVQLLAMMAGLLVAPAVAPALVWAAITANLPFTLVIVQLFVVVTISKVLLRKLIRVHQAMQDDPGDPTLNKSWSSEPASR